MKILLLPGDGIGPEVVAQGRRVLEKAAALFGLDIEFQEGLIGGVAFDATGDPLPQETLEAALSSDAVLMGAVGGPKWDRLPPAQRPEAGLLRIRKGMQVYANLRPVRVFPALVGASTLRPEVVAGVDLVVVRELTGGLYFGKPQGRFAATAGEGGERAVDTLAYSRAEVERLVRLGFELARSRRRRLTSVDKANILATSQMWRDVVEKLAQEYPDVEVQHLYVDNASMQLIRAPRQFDVIVTENMFGDILSDEAAQLGGSLGMLPSASLGEPGRPGLYEPVHGSAPDIAGTGKANPLATILTVALLLRYSLKAPAAATAVESAVARVLDEGARTADLVLPSFVEAESEEAGGQPGSRPPTEIQMCSTEEMGDRVLAALAQEVAG
ncbi:MAG: 3-isopropylmalate dehydrogenase [Limnochordaceae bacterium]|nr:3-isopropylmalate dehydrogenase [Limnochordaceae bacterium]